MKIRTGDMVKVIAGKDKGKTGKVTQAFPALNRVVVEGLNIAVKHLKGRNNQPGQRIEFPSPINVSKVMLIDPKSGKPTRVGAKILVGKDSKQTKARIAKKTGEII